MVKYPNGYWDQAAYQNKLWGDSWGTKWKAYTRIRYKKYIKNTQDMWKERCKILDIGCGGGELLKLIHKKNHMCELYGVDCSTVAVSYANKCDYIKAVCGNIENLGEIDFISGTKFDVIYCTGVIQCVARYSAILQDLRLLLSDKGGVLCIQVPIGSVSRTEENMLVKAIKENFIIQKKDYEYGKWYQDFFEKEWRESYAVAHPNKLRWIMSFALLSSRLIANLFETSTRVLGKGTLGISGKIFICKVK